MAGHRGRPTKLTSPVADVLVEDSRRPIRNALRDSIDSMPLRAYPPRMATLTIRNLSPRTHARLRRAAAEAGRSVEAEVRAILDREAEPVPPAVEVARAIRDAFAGGALPEIPGRLRSRPEVVFD